jgi:hypothetical protein
MTFLPGNRSTAGAIHGASAALLAVAALVPSAAVAARVTPAGVTASSHYPEEDGATYDADHVTDGKLGTAWVEGDQGGGLGAWVELDLGGTKTVRSVKIWGGMEYSHDYWARGNRPKDVEVSFSDGSKQTFTLTDDMKGQEFVLPAAKSTSVVRVKIRSIYDGTTWLDTAISEVQVFDDSDGARIPVSRMTASSTLAADNDGNYDPSNVGDGLADSMWCEGNKSGDGTGDWLMFDFGTSRTVSSLSLVNGIATPSMWMKANRAGTATLTFSDGTTADVTLKNVMLPQTVSFPEKSTSTVKVTFGSVVKGKEFNDLCVSEAYFPQ